jgi:hypothetical protein
VTVRERVPMCGSYPRQASWDTAMVAHGEPRSRLGTKSADRNKRLRQRDAIHMHRVGLYFTKSEDDVVGICCRPQIDSKYATAQAKCGSLWRLRVADMHSIALFGLVLAKTLDDCHVVAAHRQCGAEVFDMAVAPCHFQVACRSRIVKRIDDTNAHRASIPAALHPYGNFNSSYFVEVVEGDEVPKHFSAPLLSEFDTRYMKVRVREIGVAYKGHQWQIDPIGLLKGLSRQALLRQRDSLGRQWFVLSRAHWLTVQGLPKYAPELSDIEVVWHDLKAHHLAHQIFTDADALDRAIHAAVITLNAERNLDPLVKQRISA